LISLDAPKRQAGRHGNLARPSRPPSSTNTSSSLAHSSATDFGYPEAFVLQTPSSPQLPRSGFFCPPSSYRKPPSATYNRRHHEPSIAGYHTSTLVGPESRRIALLPVAAAQQAGSRTLFLPAWLPISSTSTRSTRLSCPSSTPQSAVPPPFATPLSSRHNTTDSQVSNSGLPPLVGSFLDLFTFTFTLTPFCGQLRHDCLSGTHSVSIRLTLASLPTPRGAPPAIDSQIRLTERPD
jgi:hypothetical protein